MYMQTNDDVMMRERQRRYKAKVFAEFIADCYFSNNHLLLVCSFFSFYLLIL